MSETSAPSAWLRLKLLGGCEITLPDGPLHLETAKTQALLVYLSSHPGPQPRHTLMGLLWGELPELRARRNLRRALWNLRRQLSRPDQPPPIVADRRTACFNREVSYWSDVEAFEAACSSLDPTLPTPAIVQHVELARQAAELYQGEFLEGFYVNDAAAFEEWALAERERLRAMALRALEYLVAGLAARNDTGGALDVARELIALEPWLEEGHRWLMRLLARTGRRAEALAQYEACRQILAQELGVEPARETQVLAEQIRSGDLAAPISNLPASTTPFVGRTRELAEIADLLADPGCRLLTVTGLGGAGKTRLAREAATQQMSAYAHGVHYVAFGGPGATGRLAAALVQSLDIPLIGSAAPQATLFAYLREKEMLLVMDGFEHLLEEASLLTEILQVAPGVKILVTSRERLNLRGEWIYLLLGLECVAEEQVGKLASSDAAQLFLQTARRVYLGFQVRDGERLHLARICNLVGGLPLAIELAAAWVRVLSLEEIAAEISLHLDFLTTANRDRPERHRSLRAVFDRSWRLLSEIEEDAFRKLSVFQDGFGPHEAARVSGVSLPTLSALVDKSLLQRTTSGRYQMHEISRQYALDQLDQAPGRQERVRDLHCRVYAEVVAQSHQDHNSVPHHQIVRSFAADKENILVAWQRAIQQGNLKAMALMHRGLTDYYHLTSSFREGEALFRGALDVLGWPEAGDRQASPGDLLAWELQSVQAMFSIYLGQLPQARESLSRCVVVFEHHGVGERVAHCHYFLGEIARFSGELYSAGELFRQGLVEYQRIDDRPAVGFCLNGLGLVASALNELAQARSYFRDSLAAFVEIDHEMGQAIASINLADLLIKLGELQAARKVLDEGSVLCQRLGHRWGMATCLQRLGDIAGLEGGAEAAKARYRESLDILEDIGQRQIAAGCLIKLAKVCTELGEYLEAGRCLKRALSFATELGDAALTLEAATSLVSLLAAEGSRQLALQLALLVAQQPDGAPASRQRASQLAAGLARQLPPETAQRIQSQSRETSLDGVLAEWALTVAA